MGVGQVDLGHLMCDGFGGERMRVRCVGVRVAEIAPLATVIDPTKRVLLITCETVVVETPAKRATSFIVAINGVLYRATEICRVGCT